MMNASSMFLASALRAHALGLEQLHVALDGGLDELLRHGEGHAVGGRLRSEGGVVHALPLLLHLDAGHLGLVGGGGVGGVGGVGVGVGVGGVGGVGGGGSGVGGSGVGIGGGGGGGIGVGVLAGG